MRRSLYIYLLVVAVFIGVLLIKFYVAGDMEMVQKITMVWIGIWILPVAVLIGFSIESKKM